MPTIPNLLDASPLTGAELAPIVQDGDTKKASIQALADYVTEIVAVELNAAVDAAETAQGIAEAQATIATTKAGEAAGSAAAALARMR